VSRWRLTSVCPRTPEGVEKVACSSEVTFGSSLGEPQTADFGPLRADWPVDRCPRARHPRDFSTAAHGPSAHHRTMNMAGLCLEGHSQGAIFSPASRAIDGSTNPNRGSSTHLEPPGFHRGSGPKRSSFHEHKECPDRNGRGMLLGRRNAMTSRDSLRNVRSSGNMLATLGGHTINQLPPAMSTRVRPFSERIITLMRPLGPDENVRVTLWRPAAAHLGKRTIVKSAHPSGRLTSTVANPCPLIKCTIARSVCRSSTPQVPSLVPRADWLH
jgi:hypothetical protein